MEFTKPKDLKFYIGTIERTFSNTHCYHESVWSIDEVYKTNKSLSLKNGDKCVIINFTELIWGTDLLNPRAEEDVRRRYYEVNTINWIVTEGIYDGSQTTLAPLSTASFYVSDSKPYAKFITGDFCSIELSDIVFCVTNPDKSLTYVPYSTEDTDIVVKHNFVQKLNEYISKKLILDCLKQALEKVERKIITGFTMEENQTLFKFALTRGKQINLDIDMILKSIKSDSREISSIEICDTHVMIVYK